jgi:hypothetical protein
VREHFLFRSFVILFSCFSFVTYSQEPIKEKKVESDLSGHFRTDYTYFPNTPIYPGQHQHYFSGYFNPAVYFEWNKGKQLLQVTAFSRLDQYDTASTHADLREFYYRYSAKKWEASLGFKKIFWGVAESNHVGDVINQLDGLEGFDIEQKLGQPMIHLSWTPNWGTIDVIGMAYHRQLRFPGPQGRPRPPSVLNYDSTKYESKEEEYQPEIAVRYSHSFSIFDIGVSYFNGTTRPPIFVPEDPTDTTNFNFFAFYESIQQASFDLQAFTGPVLWKAEGAYRISNNNVRTGVKEKKEIYSFVGGIEYTFGNLFRSGADLGVIVEYNYDNRGIELITALDNDMFYGLRLALNDVQSSDLLIGYIVDNTNSTQRYFAEANRRLGETWKLSLQASGFNDVDEDEFIYLIRKDGFFRLSLYKYL